MKLEMDPNASFCVSAIAALIAIVVISIAGCHYTEQTKQEALKSGLEQQQDVGGGGFHWAKPKSQ